MGNRRRKVRKKKSFFRKFVSFIALALVVVMVIFGASIFNFYTGLRSSLTTTEREDMLKPSPGEQVNILILGVDVPIDGQGNVNPNIKSRTDTMMVASLDLDEGKAAVLSIPRDTRVEIPDRSSFHRINSAHVYGGPVLAVKAVENFIDVPIHYYLRTNIEGFSSIVDILGGVKIDVEKDMHYVDIYQDLYIDLKAGEQVLDGEEAMQYVRYRGQGGDISRIDRQQVFLKALADKVIRPGTLLKLPRLSGEIVKHIDTNMRPMEMMKIARIFLNATADTIEMETVPGSPRMIGGASYWIADMEKTRDIVDRLIWGIDKEKNAAIQIEVFNGTQEPGLANSIGGMLKGKGFQVVDIGNADNHHYQETKIIAYHRNQEKIKALGRVLSDGKLLYEDNKDKKVDFTIIVGKDFTG